MQQRRLLVLNVHQVTSAPTLLLHLISALLVRTVLVALFKRVRLVHQAQFLHLISLIARAVLLVVLVLTTLLPSVPRGLGAQGV